MAWIDAQWRIYPGWPDNTTTVPYNKTVVISWQPGLAAAADDQITNVNTANLDLLLVNYPSRQLAYLVIADININLNLELEYNFTNPNRNGTSAKSWELNFVKPGVVPSNSYQYVRSPRFSFLQPILTSTLPAASTASPVSESPDPGILIRTVLGSIFGSLASLIACWIGFCCLRRKWRRKRYRLAYARPQNQVATSEIEQDVEKEVRRSQEAYHRESEGTESMDETDIQHSHELETWSVHETEAQWSHESEPWSAAHEIEAEWCNELEDQGVTSTLDSPAELHATWQGHGYHNTRSAHVLQ